MHLAISNLMKGCESSFGGLWVRAFSYRGVRRSRPPGRVSAGQGFACIGGAVEALRRSGWSLTISSVMFLRRRVRQRRVRLVRASGGDGRVARRDRACGLRLPRGTSGTPRTAPCGRNSSRASARPCRACAGPRRMVVPAEVHLYVSLAIDLDGDSPAAAGSGRLWRSWHRSFLTLYFCIDQHGSSPRAVNSSRLARLAATDRIIFSASSTATSRLAGHSHAEKPPSQHDPPSLVTVNKCDDS